MQNVSTSMTVVLKFFLPTVWIVFFGTFTMGLFTADITHIAGLPIGPFRIGMLLFLVVGIAFLYWAVMKLKRVEMDDSFIYVTNYHKTYRYPYHNVDHLEERDFLFFRTIYIYFKKPGHFGKKVSFIPGRNNLNEFLRDHPGVAAQLLDKDEQS